ncbi:hypothetical protein SDC9_153906 [bioreactor metagenome]|uniref:Uncharacterized protein n=1 Tax=bioreactor metagenome TaxID=1076179 RepID=A0A645EYU6_9ZZZZ
MDKILRMIRCGLNPEVDERLNLLIIGRDRGEQRGNRILIRLCIVRNKLDEPLCRQADIFNISRRLICLNQRSEFLRGCGGDFLRIGERGFLRRA